MSKRNTYLMGGAAIAVGITLIVIAFTSMSDDGGGDSSGSAAEKRSAAREEPSPAPRRAAGPPSAKTPEGKSLSQAVARRRPVQAPGFALEVVDKGSPPAQARPLAQAVTGDSLALTRLRGSPIVLNVWSSDCGPCRSDARLIETTWQRWGRRGVAFVGLSVGESADAAQKYADEYDLSYPIVRDAGGRVANAYGVRNLPETFFISSTGEIVGHVAGRPSVRQMELGTAAARANRTFGSEQGGSRVPHR
jgi:cytochrome c biogenesis protein CcmG/thiol:disulfide interchange protein DsbE